MRTAVLSVPTGEAELAADRMWLAGARAVEERASRAGRTELLTMLGPDDATSRARLGDLPSGWELTFREVDPTPSDTWRQFARSVIVSDTLVLRPAWLPATARPGVIEVSIEPGASFGLGDHPTTRLSAGLVHRLVRADDRVLDIGCGSGVLAIIAALGGAGIVVGIDVSDSALDATVANAVRNGVDHRITVSATTVEALADEFDLVVANILAPTLVAMAPELRRLTAPRGTLVVSGVLADDHQHVVAALGPMQVAGTHTLEGWAAIELRHP